jgi:uncharacterized protein
MERLQAVLSHPDFEVYLKLNEEQEVNREFCGHQLQHALDVARICYILCLEEGQDSILLEKLGSGSISQARELIYAAALLHDIGRWKQYLNPGLDHAQEGAILAKPILQDAGFNQDEIKVGLAAIRAHRNSQAGGLGRLLYRADKLSRNCIKCGVRLKCKKLAEMETADSIIY